MAAKGGYDAGVVVVADFGGLDAGGRSTFTFGAGDGCDRVFACFEKSIGDKFADGAADLVSLLVVC